VNETAALLLAEMRDGRAADIKGAVKMHLHYRVELFGRHIVEHAIAQNARVVHHHVNAAKTVDRLLHHRLSVIPTGHAAAVRHRAAGSVGLGDFGDDALRWPVIVAFAGHARADVVDHDLSAIGGEGNRRRAPNSATGTSNDGNLAIQHSHSYFLLKQSGPRHNASGRGLCHHPSAGRWVGLQAQSVQEVMDRLGHRSGGLDRGEMARVQLQKFGAGDLLRHRLDYRG